MVSLTEETIGSCKDQSVKKYTWHTPSGFSVSVISYGAIIQAIRVPDKHGEVADVVLGFDNLQDYVNKNEPHFGSTVGRCANRIGGASFEIDGTTYTLAKNISGKDHLHGGIIGFDKVNWESSVKDNTVVFSYLSKDGEEGYPGNLITNVIYEVKDDTLYVKFMATTTKRTVVNLTNHSYFNLAGHAAGARELYDHVISINADRITETSAASIPTGRFTNVGGTLYDLRIPTRLGDRMDKDPKLYDDNFCVTNYDKGLRFVSRVHHPYSGRFLELYSDQPGVQLFTSDNLPGPNDPALIGKDGEGYRRHGAFCLETQNFPDAVHHQNFPSAILSPGEVYTHTVTYKFGVLKDRSPEVVIS
ncbi:galactose mutarotase-like [Aricia agestis]|uniref:galactose mutarotase-like n=1 Tax=Aricia agestis TaxID=91739 RepID=UPI001C2057BB|nr:galactose mutarotase-like [Aricia agestis]XP_041969329.1 galactose mutarotase-like [Aricia agestis]XP_041969330.1 galactose mutarotase-like [Aricia agestis]